MPILLIISALALSFAFAPFGARFLAYFAFVPLLLTISKYPYKKVFWYAFIFGSVFALFHLWWLYFLIVPVELTTKILLILGVTVLFAYLGLYTAVFAVITKYLGIAFAPLIWAIFEFIRTKSEIGFPWGLIGYTQTPYIPIVQLASIFGVYGLSAWVLWINLVLYWIIVKKNKLTYLIILLISFILPLSYGLIRIKTTPATALKVAIVQPNVSPFEKGDYESRSRLINQFISLTKQAISAKPDLIVFPETATIVDITRNQLLQDTIQAIIDSAQTYLFTGTPLFEPNQPIYYNGAVLFEPNYQGFRSVYRKIHLVPFSEKIPYADKIALFRKIETNDMGNCTPGKEYTVFSLTSADGKTKRFSCLICFESIFPDLTREFTKRGADLLINVTNDGWFGKTPGPYQHCELAILRSVENGVPLIRCANNGISLIADVYAQTKYRTKLFTETIVFGTITESLSPTFYRKYGDILIYLSIVLIFVALIIRPFKKSKLQPKQYYKYH